MKRRFVTIALVAGALLGFSSGFHHVRSHYSGHRAERTQQLAERVADRVVERLAAERERLGADTPRDHATCPDRATSVVHHYYVHERGDRVPSVAGAASTDERPARSAPPVGGDPGAQ